MHNWQVILMEIIQIDNMLRRNFSDIKDVITKLDKLFEETKQTIYMKDEAYIPLKSTIG
jgi:hypothetical protein